MGSKYHTAALLVLLSCALGACKSGSQSDASPAASASGAVATASGGIAVASASALPRPDPISSAEIAKTLNPEGAPVVEGATGTVRGVVRATGDPPPDESIEAPQGGLRPECKTARDVYGKAFRVGPDGALADVLVGVVGYDKFVPPEGEGPVVTVRDCAFDARTVALTYGQNVRVLNKGGQSVIPELIGERTRALLVAMPGGEPVRLYPSKVGHYAMVDQSHPFATADVFVLRFSTFDVTGTKGRFEIDRLPPGEVKVTAYLPATAQTVEKSVVIEPGKTVEITFELPYDKTKHAIRGKMRDKD